MLFSGKDAKVQKPKTKDQNHKSKTYRQVLFYFWYMVLRFDIWCLVCNSNHAPVVQWIRHEPPKLGMQVRFLPGAQSEFEIKN